jgi:hypothetical protein
MTSVPSVGLVIQRSTMEGKPYTGQIMAPFENNLIIDYDGVFAEWGINLLS